MSIFNKRQGNDEYFVFITIKYIRNKIFNMFLLKNNVCKLILMQL